MVLYSKMLKKIIFLLFLFVYSLLNAQVNEDSAGRLEHSGMKELIIELINDSVLNNNDTVWVLNEGKREKVIVRIMRTVRVSDLKISGVGLLYPALSWRSFLDVMEIAYKPLEGLIVDYKFEFCTPYSNSLHNTIKSSDGNFLARIEHYFTGIYPHSARSVGTPDSLLLLYNKYYQDREIAVARGAVNNFSTAERNARYFEIARDHLIDIAGKYKTDYRNQFSMKDLEKNVKFITGKNGQLPFNADKTIRYPLPVKPVNGDISFPKKYSNCEVLILHKQDLGPVIFYCFFTKDGYKKRDDYFAMLEKAFVFK